MTKKNETLKLDATTKKYLIEKLKNISLKKNQEVTKAFESLERSLRTEYTVNCVPSLIQDFYNDNFPEYSFYSDYCLAEGLTGVGWSSEEHGEACSRFDKLKNYVRDNTKAHVESEIEEERESMQKSLRCIEKYREDAELEIMLGKDYDAIKSVLSKFENKKF